MRKILLCAALSLLLCLTACGAAGGADSFDAFLHDWYTGHQFAEVTTADFRAALKSAAGENPDVDALVEEYLSPVE